MDWPHKLAQINSALGLKIFLRQNPYPAQTGNEILTGLKRHGSQDISL